MPRSAGGARASGPTKGDLSQSRYAGTLAMRARSNLSGFQPANANLTSISAIPGSNSGLLLDTSGVFTTTTLALVGDVTGSITTASTTLTLATVNSNIGTFAAITINGKGLATAGVNLSGDGTTSGAVLTLATVNSNVGTFNSVTVNGKGLVTAASNVKQAPSYQAITATALQTVFTTTVNTITNKLMVFNLRIKQIEGTDYTITGANQITFGAGITLNNIVEFYAFA